MTEEERERIISEEFADLLVEYSGDYSVFDRFPNATVRIINYIYAVVHIPAQLLTMEFVANLGYTVMPHCFGLISEASLEATKIPRIRNIPNFSLRGQGVLIGVIDTGIDYLNPIFQYADGTTRIVSIWDQTIESENYPEVGLYGTEFTREEINLALLSDNPLELVPTMDFIGHGTMVAGIAAGNEVPIDDFYGVAPASELVVVKLKQCKQSLREFFVIPEEVVCYSEVDILYGINYLLNVSSILQRPIAICLALGSSQGGHDGRGVLSNTMSIIGRRSGTAVVVAAGNEGNERRHYYGEVDRLTGYDTVELMVGQNEKGFVMELWGKSPSIYSIDITSPTGEYVPRIAASLNVNTEVSFLFEQTTLYLLYEMVETQTGDQLILLRFVNPAPGIWRFRVYERGDLNLGFHIWLPMSEFISPDTYFIRSDIFTTVLALGNAIVPLTVTAYNALDDSLYLYASRGFTRTEVVKPEITAPGVNVIGPTLDHGFVAYTGTSVAAAHTTGVAAMLLEWGFIRGNIPNMSTVELKKMILRGARRDEDINYPNRDWGYGILDIFNVFDSLRTGVVI
ncbi:S8 family peptidase [Mobilitalea sibirica]|uniref:S8 family peptidase n=1 Tax=Mobilitalea sibirica TaxID=1462919 RepID=A0A8J7H0Z8_9FIRM|nr:S8 family peptidase [Mobilitalea sibirica]MBH1939630.1 S8 family peptidase [Mobilitalea sibirica]